MQFIIHKTDFAEKKNEIVNALKDYNFVNFSKKVDACKNTKDLIQLKSDCEENFVKIVNNDNKRLFFDYCDLIKGKLYVYVRSIDEKDVDDYFLY